MVFKKEEERAAGAAPRQAAATLAQPVAASVALPPLLPNPWASRHGRKGKGWLTSGPGRSAGG